LGLELKGKNETYGFKLSCNGGKKVQGHLLASHKLDHLTEKGHFLMKMCFQGATLLSVSMFPISTKRLKRAVNRWWCSLKDLIAVPPHVEMQLFLDLDGNQIQFSQKTDQPFIYQYVIIRLMHKAITLKDFCPLNRWVISTPSNRIIDCTTGREYLNQSQSTIRYKCLLLTVLTPIIHLIAGVEHVAYRIIRLVSFYNFWSSDNKTWEDKFKAAGKDLLLMITQPLAVLSLQLSALYGLLRPLDGRKLYATIERAQYPGFASFAYTAIGVICFGEPYGEYYKELAEEPFLFAPCFQPDATSHFFGGDIKSRDAW